MRLTPLAAALLALALPLSAGAADFGYTSTVLTRSGLLSTSGLGLNDAGVVVGTATTAGAPGQSAFIASGGTLTLFNVSGQPTEGAAINNAGVWAGTTVNAGSGLSEVFIRVGATNTFLPGLGINPEFVHAINDSGQVAGSVIVGNQSAAFWGNGNGTRLLPGLGSGASVAYGINNAAQVVGQAHIAGGDSRAVLWQNGLVSNLGTLGGDSSTATAINNRGVVVGGANSTSGGAMQAFIWQGGTMRSLGTLGDDSMAIAVNDRNLVVGHSVSVFGASRAFVAGGQGMHDLNDWLTVAPTGSQRLTTATDVNLHGQILARNEAGFAVLLTPQGTLRWAAGGDGSFTDGAAWDSGVGQGPSRFLDMVLAHPSSQTVEMSESAEVRSLVIGGGGGAGGGQMRLRLSAGAVLTSSNAIVVERSGTLTGDGVIAADVLLAGTLQVGCGFSSCGTGTRLYQDGSHSFDVRHGGLVTGSGLLEAGLTVQAGGEVRAGAGQLLRLVAPGGIHTSNGVIEVRDGGELRVGGSLLNRLGTVRIDGGTVRFAQGLDNQSRIDIGFGGAAIYGPVRNQAGARIVASGGSNTTFWDTLTNNGEIRASAGSRIVYFGPVNGAGSFTTNGDGAYHRFEGGFAPGNSPADVVLGTTQLASTLTMEMGGTAPGTQHDRITFTGLLTLDAGAQLEVVLIDGFVPQLGQVFDLFVFEEGVAGHFGQLRLPALNPGWDWDTSALYTAGDLRVAVAVPEPGSWLSLGVGLLALVARRRFGRDAAARA